MLKPQTKGGLLYVLVPENFNPENYPYDPQQVDTRSMIHEPDQVQKLLMLQNKKP
jgi:hypothetical protein